MIATAASGLPTRGFAAAALARITPRFALVAAAIGFVLWLVCSTNWTESYALSVRHWLSWLVTSGILTACFAIGVVASDEAVDRGASRFATYATAVVIASAAGSILQYFALRATGLPIWGEHRRWEIAYTEPAYIFLQGLNFGGLAVFVYASLRESIEAARRRNASGLAHAQARRQSIESQLQAMQARVEPQFLFNTLAQVRTQYDFDPARAARMLDDLITYLRAALPHLRESSSTLGKELELVQAYVNIVQTRGGDRRAFFVEAPGALAGARIPPMLLLPLVDHALVRGLAGGGPATSLALAANAAGGRLRVSLTDATGGSARGIEGAQPAELSHIADRVAALYGGAGSFLVTLTPDGGACATLEVPHEIADDDHR